MRKLSIRKTFISKLRDKIKETKRSRHERITSEFNGIFSKCKNLDFSKLNKQED